MIYGRGIRREYVTPAGRFTALDGVDVDIPAGTFVILKGRSGSGKTTLMNILSSLDDPTQGEVSVAGIDLKSCSTRRREELRRHRMGFVFQSVALLPGLTAWQNVEFSMRMAGIRAGKERDKRVEECLTLLGLGKRMTHLGAELSGGEQQRVAIARAMAHRPEMIFADEPTAELDSAMAVRVTEVFRRISRTDGITVVMTTHDTGLMGAADILIELDHGVRVG